MPDYQRLGFASEAVAGLIGWAFSHPDVLLVAAATLAAQPKTTTSASD
jgi:RimJ/RimL family protein N-acetyltransferase